MVLIFLVDALRHDFISPTGTPFLYKIAKHGIYVKLQPTLGFEGRPAFFSGLYPEHSDIAFRYVYDPKNSPYKLARLLTQFPLQHELQRKLLTFVTRKRCRDPFLRCVLYPREIPLDLIHFFSFGEKRFHWEPLYLNGKRTLFDDLRSTGQYWVINSWPSPQYGLSISGVLNFFDAVCSNRKIDFFYSTISDVDLVEHRYGPDSEQAVLRLLVVDRVIEVIFKKIAKIYGKEPRLLVFGDHGAVSVKRCVDLETKIRSLPLRIGRDFVYFLDSVMARFWVHSKRASNIIKNMLVKDCADFGRILDEDDLSRYHFHVSRGLKGDILFLANPGVLIFPYFHNRQVPEKGMHGYDPEYPEEHAASVIYTGEAIQPASRDKFETVDIYPTILHLLGLPQVEDIDGCSIIA